MASTLVLRTLALSFVCSIPCVMASAAWDVADTGQPCTEAKFTVSEGTWMSLDVSSDGRTIVFDLLGDIYSLPVTGGDATLIHGGPAMEHSPRFSPNGTELIYVSDKDGSDNLWISNADGSASRRLTGENLDALVAPAWDPTGPYAVAARFSSRGGANGIWLYHLRGGKGRLLLASPERGQTVHEPAFSRDGRYLYYTQNVAPPAGLYVNALQPTFAIKRRDLTNGTQEEVVRGFGGATTAQPSPDGKRMAFVRRVKEKTVLFVYDFASGEQRAVYDALERGMHANSTPSSGTYYPQYAWLPDSRQVVIWSAGKLHRIDVDTRERREIPFRVQANHRITLALRPENSLAPPQVVVRAIQQLAVAPDGGAAVFSALGHLWQKPLPDGKPHRLTRRDVFEFEPRYSPDGSRVVFVSWDDEHGATLELLVTKTGKVTSLLRGLGIVRQPAFSADGKRLVFWVEQGNRKMGGFRGKAGVYWMPVEGGQPHRVAPTGEKPSFSPDGNRIYYTVRVNSFYGLVNTGNTLASVRLDGSDKRTHVSSNELTDFALSPDARWLAYKSNQQYFVVPYRETGAAIELTRNGGEVPATQLTEAGGYGIAWSADSTHVSWMFGSVLQRAAAAGFSTGVAIATSSDLNLVVPSDRPEGVLAFTHGRIITLRGEEVIEDGSIMIEGNRIASLGPADRIAIPKEAKVIDVRGKTLMPGLVDMHGHLDSVKEPLLMPQKDPDHYAAVAFGVTTNMDPASAEPRTFAAAEMNLAGVTVGPRYITTGRHVLGTDMLGGYYPITSLDDARRIVAHKRALGAIIVKSYDQRTRRQRQQLVKAARDVGIMVTPEGEGHFYNDLTMILDGHMSVEHNIPVANYYDDLVQLVARSSTSLTPTLVVNYGETMAENYFYQTTRPWDDPKIRVYAQSTRAKIGPLPGADEAPPYVRGMVSLHQSNELWDIGFRSLARALKKVDDAGGVVTTGGHGQLQGLDLHWEMWALAEGGMSNHHVLRAATSNGARTLGVDKQIGTLEPGKLADLIVLDANPLENIRNTNTVRFTLVNGRLYDSLSMNEIGNYRRSRTRFYWELPDYAGIDWNESWGGPGIHGDVEAN